MTFRGGSDRPAHPETVTVAGDGHIGAEEPPRDPAAIGLGSKPGDRDSAVASRMVTDHAPDPILVGLSPVMQVTRQYFQLALDDLMASMLPRRDTPGGLRPRAVPIPKWERDRSRGRWRGGP
jgi:hypothetical protein